MSVRIGSFVSLQTDAGTAQAIWPDATYDIGSREIYENAMADNPPIDLEALDRYLGSDLSPENCMGLSDLDGFLTGVIIGPELILPSEWLPLVWGGEEPNFETESEMQTIIGTIMGRYNEIATCFESDPYQFEPLFLEGQNGEVIASDWAAGFLDAVALRPKAWVPLFIDRQARIMVEPF